MIKIICVGKIKEKFFKEALLEYQKRLSKYTKIEIIEVSDFSYGDIEVEKLKEMQEIKKHIKDREYIVTLEIEGKSYSSKEFSSWLEKTNSNYPTITFIIGGSNGLHDDIKKSSKEAISFSKLTFPHQLFRVILLEQIYRAYKIQKNENYHK